MHRSLTPWIVHRPAPFRRQQRRRRVEEFNWQRSHPWAVWDWPACTRSSPRPPERLPEVEYHERGHRPAGASHREFKWRGRLIYLSTVLAKEPIALVPCDNDRWEIRYSFHRLGLLDQPTRKIIPAQQWHQRE